MMKILRLFILFFSIIIIQISAQAKKNKFNLMIGFDALHLGLGEFTDQRMFQFFASTEVKPKAHLVMEVGYEENKYDKNAYDVVADGNFIKAGMLYMFNTEVEDRQNGFYIGGKLATSFYWQYIMSIPIRGPIGIGNSEISLSKSPQSAYWIDASVGGRVRILGTNFFIDAQIQPKYLIFSTKQENITPMVIPGFGVDAGAFKLGFMWSLAYLF